MPPGDHAVSVPLGLTESIESTPWKAAAGKGTLADPEVLSHPADATSGICFVVSYVEQRVGGRGAFSVGSVTSGQYLVLYAAPCAWVVGSRYCLFLRTSCLPVPPQSKHTGL